jgi:uncharacterized protein (DUF983 family)
MSNNYKEGLKFMQTREELLKKAIDTGEVIKIRYNGGSQPGTIREITPLKIDGAYLEAFCSTQKRNRTFVISKIEVVSSSTEITFKKNDSAIIKRECNFKESRVNKYKLTLTVKCQECGKDFIDKKLFETEDLLNKYEEDYKYKLYHLCPQCYSSKYHDVEFSGVCSSCGNPYSFNKSFSGESELVSFKNWFENLDNPLCRNCRGVDYTEKENDDDDNNKDYTNYSNPQKIDKQGFLGCFISIIFLAALSSCIYFVINGNPIIGIFLLLTCSLMSFIFAKKLSKNKSKEKSQELK